MAAQAEDKIVLPVYPTLGEAHAKYLKQEYKRSKLGYTEIQQEFYTYFPAFRRVYGDNALALFKDAGEVLKQDYKEW